MTEPYKLRSRRGFSLVELLLVLVIVSVVAAIAMPRFAQATSRQKLEAAANRVAADLNKAHARARAASETVTLTFSTTSDSYTFSAIGGSASTVTLASAPYGVDISAASFGSNNNVASFNGYGVPAYAGYVILALGTNTVRVDLLENGEATR